jgi:methionyl-tRNA synthetase
MPTSAGEILRRIGDSKAAQYVRIGDTAWRTSGEKRVLNEGPLWPRRELEKGASLVTDTLNSPSPEPAAARAVPATSASARTDPGELPRDLAEAASGREGGPEPGLTQAAAPVVDDRISIEDFMKVQLRVAKIVEAERVPKSKKLVKMSIDVGTERRTIVAGIAEAYEPEALVGKTVVIVANLKPAKLMGIESNGMVLAASPEGGMPIVINAEPAAPGTRVR